MVPEHESTGATEADVVVLGLGVGGERVAQLVAEGGCSVIGVESRLVGGECAYWGCVPTKMIVRAANVLAEARRVERLAGSSAVAPDWRIVARRLRDDATHSWTDDEAAERLRDAGVRVVRGPGRFAAPNTVVVAGEELTARHAVVVATGTEPAIPPIPGLDGVPFLTNREFVEVETLRGSLAVLGGGAIGLELAQAARRFGPAVTVVEADDRLLAQEEPEAGRLVARVLRDDGIDVRTGVEVERIEGDQSAVTLTLADANGVDAQRVLVATGRVANLRALDLARAGLDPDAKHIAVDEHLRAAPGIWAIGDVTEHGGFTHVAAAHASVAAADILGRPGPPAEAHAIPRVVFTDPEVGAVGLTEAQAREQGVDVAVSCADGSDSARGWLHGSGDAELVKLVVDCRAGVLVGATTVGPAGAEVMAMLTLAVHARIPLATLQTMIYAYPTFHRTIATALERVELA